LCCRPASSWSNKDVDADFKQIRHADYTSTFIKKGLKSLFEGLFCFVYINVAGSLDLGSETASESTESTFSAWPASLLLSRCYLGVSVNIPLTARRRRTLARDRHDNHQCEVEHIC
jgi:hypothetical protein